jgi:hypothetical protein
MITLSHRPPYRDPQPLATSISEGYFATAAPRTPARLTAAAAKARAMTLADNLLDTLQRLDPGLEGPLYVVFAPLHMQNLSAQYVPGAAAIFAADARAANKWHGRGHGILLAEEQYATDYEAAAAAGMAAPQAHKLARRSFSAKIVHEFAHALSGGFDGREGPLGREDFDADAVRSVALDGSPGKVQASADHDAALPPFDKHHAKFLRAAIHLALRMKPHVKGLTLDDVVVNQKYGLAPIWHYVAALGSELKSKAPIRTLLARPAPAEFRELWKNDVAKWLFAIPSPTPEQEKAAEQALASCPR